MLDQALQCKLKISTLIYFCRKTIGNARLLEESRTRTQELNVKTYRRQQTTFTTPQNN